MLKAHSRGEISHLHGECTEVEGESPPAEGASPPAEGASSPAREHVVGVFRPDAEEGVFVASSSYGADLLGGVPLPDRVRLRRGGRRSWTKTGGGCGFVS